MESRSRHALVAANLLEQGGCTDRCSFKSKSLDYKKAQLEDGRPSEVMGGLPVWRCSENLSGCQFKGCFYTTDLMSGPLADDLVKT